MENLHGKFKQDERSLEFPNYQSSTNKYLSNERNTRLTEFPK